MGLINLNTSFWNFSDNPFAPTTIAYPGIEISGSKGGWSGFHFKEFNRQFLVRADMQGVFSYQEAPGWHWRFNNGKLDIGSVPWSQLIDVPYADANEPGLVSNESSGAWSPTLRGQTTAGTASYGTNAGSWCRTGNIVLARFFFSNVSLSGVPSAEGLRIAGLPFSAIAGSTFAGFLTIGDFFGWNLGAGYNYFGGRMGANTIELTKSGSTNPTPPLGSTVYVARADLVSSANQLSGAIMYGA